jgi:hypothetical protein
MASPPGLTRGKLVGVGSLRDETNSIYYPSHGRITFTPEYAEVALPDQNYSIQNVYWALMQGFSGTVEWHDIEAQMLATMLGGTVTDDIGLDQVVEDFVVAAVTFDATLTNAATCRDESVVSGAVILTSATGEEIRCKNTGLVAPAAIDEFQCAVGVLQFNAAAVGLAGTCDYMYTDVTGRHIDIPPTALPGQFEALLDLGLYVDENTLEHVIIKAKRFIWTSAFSLATPRGDHEAISRDFRINNRVAGDLVIYTR